DVSETIVMKSNICRYHEHSRVIYFINDGDECVYLSSADCMDRNFFRRVEVAFPVLDKKLRKRVIDESFTFALRDTELAWIQGPDGDYKRVRTRRAPFNLHKHLMKTLGGVDCED